MLAQPWFYTTQEAGMWIPWPEEAPILTEEGLKDTLQINTSHIFGATVWFKGMNMPIHALKFENGSEWDCLNGMRFNAPFPQR